MPQEKQLTNLDLSKPVSAQSEETLKAISELLK